MFRNIHASYGFYARYHNVLVSNQACSIPKVIQACSIMMDGKKQTLVADVSSEPQPFSAMPRTGGHWITNVFEVLFRHGGLKTSFYTIQENMIRKDGLICKKAGVLTDEVHVADPAAMQTVFSLEEKYPTRFAVPFLDDFYARHKKEPGVFFLNGEKWHKHKMVMSKKMLRPPQIGSYIPRICNIASDMTSRLKTVRNHNEGDKFGEINDLDMELFKWSFETVSDFLFDRPFHSLTENPPKRTVDFITSIGKFLESIVAVSVMPPSFYKYVKTKAFKECDENFMLLYKFAEELIKEKLEDLSQKQNCADSDSGLIPFLLSTIGEEEVGSSIVDTLFAGVDTTSNTMQWLLYRLAKNPDVQERIRDEVSKVVNLNAEISEAELKRLPLVKAAIKEILRLYPVLIITSRKLPCDAVLSGYHVPAGKAIFFCHHAMGRREDLFSQADSFIPERWLRDNNRLAVNAFASIPFGFGVRMCLGRRLAELELQILLVKILQNFRLEISPNHVVRQYMRGTNIPDKPIRVKFIDIN